MSDYDTLMGLLKNRYSCRAYLDKEVPEDVITQIVTAAGRAPSWCNAQPWQVTITRGNETERSRNALIRAAGTQPENPDVPGPEGYSGRHKDRRRNVGWQLYEAVGVAKGDREGSLRQARKNFALFGAPHTAILTSGRELGTYGALDSGGFLMAFCLAAQALGVATVPQAAVAFHSPVVREVLDIPDDRLILCAITFGYADPDHPANSFRATRAPLDEIMAIKG
jgi:nitroreductase